MMKKYKVLILLFSIVFFALAFILKSKTKVAIIDFFNFEISDTELNDNDKEYLDSLSYILVNSECSIKFDTNKYYIYNNKKTINTLIKIRNNLDKKLDIITNNILQKDSTRTSNGLAYRRKIVYFNKDGDINVEEDFSPFRLIYDPAHPDAIKTGLKKGYVEFPNVNIVTETTLLISTKKEIIYISKILYNLDQSIIISENNVLTNEQFKQFLSK